MSNGLEQIYLPYQSDTSGKSSIKVKLLITYEGHFIFLLTLPGYLSNAFGAIGGGVIFVPNPSISTIITVKTEILFLIFGNFVMN